MKRLALSAVAVFSVLLVACGNDANLSREGPTNVGPGPVLPEGQRGLLPNMTIASPARWDDQLPTVPWCYAIAAIARDLRIPRQSLVLPNGDILVAKGKGGGAPRLTPRRT